MSDEGIDERHLGLLGAVDEVARHSNAGVSLSPVCKEADRQEFMRLTRDLQEARYVDERGIRFGQPGPNEGGAGTLNIRADGRIGYTAHLPASERAGAPFKEPDPCV
jgi:hypothetical protein